jgi:phosphosulfolactate phosphohydrolase-like enzyme
VLRAFTTAAYALAPGAERIVLIGAVSDAEALRARLPSSLHTGQIGGAPIPAWELSKSPVEVAAANVAGRTLVQRTSAGTQGVLAVPHATPIFCASLVRATATAHAINRASADPTYAITGWSEDVAADTDGQDLVVAEPIDHPPPRLGRRSGTVPGSRAPVSSRTPLGFEPERGTRRRLCACAGPLPGWSGTKSSFGSSR